MARMNEVERRQHLLEHGAQLFAAAPVHALSMSAIADGAGCSKALLYHYFGGRHGYYVAVLESIAARLIKVMAPGPEPDFALAFQGSLERFLAFVANDPASYRMLVQAGVGVDAEAQGAMTKVRNAAAMFLRARLLQDHALQNHALEDHALQNHAAPDNEPLFETALYGWVSFSEAAALHWADGDCTVPTETMIALLTEALAPVRFALEAS